MSRIEKMRKAIRKLLSHILFLIYLWIYGTEIVCPEWEYIYILPAWLLLIRLLPNQGLGKDNKEKVDPIDQTDSRPPRAGLGYF